jgi:hypothetical protein
VSEAFDLFTKIASDSVVIALKPRTTVPRTNVLGIYGATAAALSRLNDAQKAKLLERIAAPFRIYQIKNEGVREYR